MPVPIPTIVTDGPSNQGNEAALQARQGAVAQARAPMGISPDTLAAAAQAAVRASEPIKSGDALTPPPGLFRDIPGFASAADLEGVATDPGKLQQFLETRFGELNMKSRQYERDAQILAELFKDERIVAAIDSVVNPQRAPEQVEQRRGKQEQNDPVTAEIRRLQAKIQQLEGGLGQFTKEREFLNQVQTFARSHPDFFEHADSIQRILAERPHLQLEDAYEIVRARAGQQPERPAQPQFSERPAASANGNGRGTDLRELLRDRAKYPTTESAVAAMFAQHPTLREYVRQ